MNDRLNLVHPIDHEHKQINELISIETTVLPSGLFQGYIRVSNKGPAQQNNVVITLDSTHGT